MSESLPSVDLTIQDNSLGGSAGTSDDAGAFIGVSTGGTANTVYTLRSLAALALLQSGPTGGPGLEAAALDLVVSGKPVYFVPVNQSDAGTMGTILKNGGAQTDVATTGTPKDAYAFAVKITKGGARGVARYRISFDYDAESPHWSDEILTAASVATGLSGTGLTAITFAVQTYVLGDVYAATCTAPGYDTDDLIAAFNALKADQSRTFRFVHVVGEGADAAATLAMATALDTLLATAQTGKRFTWGQVDAADDTNQNLIDAFVNFTSKRVGVAAGFADIDSVLTGRTLKRSAGWAILARIHKLRISQDAGEVAEGPLEFVRKLYHDEATATTPLDAGRFSTLRTLPARKGFFPNQARLMAPDQSDFELVQFRQVMDLGSTVALVSLTEQLNKSFLVNADGTIDEAEALDIESTTRAALAEVLLTERHATSIEVLVDRTINLRTTKKIKVTIRITPLGYAKTIDVDLGFSNVKIAGPAPV